MLPSKSASTSNIRTEGLREISIQSSQIKLAPPRTHTVHETQMHRNNAKPGKELKARHRNHLAQADKWKGTTINPTKATAKDHEGRTHRTKAVPAEGTQKPKARQTPITEFQGIPPRCKRTPSQ